MEAGLKVIEAFQINWKLCQTSLKHLMKLPLSGILRSFVDSFITFKVIILQNLVEESRGFLKPRSFVKVAEKFLKTFSKVCETFLVIFFRSTEVRDAL